MGGDRCRYSHSSPIDGVVGGSGQNALKVLVKNAANLRNTDGLCAGVSNPYVILRLVDAKGGTVAGPKQTSVKDDTLDPVWNEEVVFEGLDTPAAYTLQANVLDKDTLLGTGLLDWMSKDDALGDGKVDLGTLYRVDRFQDCRLVIEQRKLGLIEATLNIALSTQGQWGNGTAGAAVPGSEGYSKPSSRPPCKYWAAGYCKDAERCRYSHANPE